MSNSGKNTIKWAEELIIYELEFIYHLNEHPCLAAGLCPTVTKSGLTVFVGWLNLTDIQEIPGFCATKCLSLFPCFGFSEITSVAVLLLWCRALSIAFCVGIPEWPRILSFFKVHFLFDFPSIQTIMVSGKNVSEA